MLKARTDRMIVNINFIIRMGYFVIQFTKVHKKRDFLCPVYKKVKTVTIFVGEKRS